jgi:hypothetical protein
VKDTPNLFASVFVLDGRAESEVRALVEQGLGCVFDPEFARSDDHTTTWFADAFGFEIAFCLREKTTDGGWYSVALAPGFGMLAPDAEMKSIDFHVAQLLRNAGLNTVLTVAEYRARTAQ